MNLTRSVSSSFFSRNEVVTRSAADLTSFASVPLFRNSFHVFDHIDESFFFFDVDYQLVYINKTGSEMLEKAYGIRLFPGENILQKLPSERREKFSQVAEKVMCGEESDYELEITNRKLWIYCKYFPHYAPDGTINGFYGLIKDITTKKEISRLEQKAVSMQQDLFRSRLLFEQFMQNSPLTAWLTDADGNVQYMNPIYLKTYGFTEKDFGRSLYDLFDPQIAVDYHLNNRRVLQKGESIETIEKGIKENGEEQVLKIYKFPLQVGNEIMVGGWGVDITDQMELQEKLIQSIERHEYVNEATSDAIYDWDFSNGKLYRSNRFEELFGFTEKTVSLRHRMKLIHPDDIKEFKRVVFSSLRNGAINRWQVEYRLKVGPGSYRNVMDKAFIIRGKNKVSRVIGAIQDTTSQKELQRQLVNQEKRSKRELIKSIIETQEKERRQLSVELHDNVNQMLASCKLMLEVAKENGSNAKMLTEKTYQSIQTVINEIRKISHDLNPSAIVDVGLVDAIEQLIEKINLSGKINILFVPDKRHYKEYLNEEDKIAIFRIIQEQLSNILKHAAASQVVIRLEVVKGMIRMCIKDDGVGFDLEKCKKGLGLRNIYNRVEYYGGTIRIDTGIGRGCELCITLKLRNAITQQLRIA